MGIIHHQHTKIGSIGLPGREIDLNNKIHPELSLIPRPGGVYGKRRGGRPPGGRRLSLLNSA